MQKSETDWKAATTVVTFRPGAQVDPTKLDKGMDGAGFGMEELRLVVQGTPTTDQGRPAFRVSNTGQLFLIAAGQEQLQGVAGKEVTVSAKVDLQAGGPPFKLAIEKVEP